MPAPQQSSRPHAPTEPAPKATAQPQPQPQPQSQPHGADLKTKDYEAGRKAVSPSLGDLTGLPKSPQEAAQAAQRSVTSVDAGATLGEGGTVAREEGIEVVFDPGTRMNAHVDSWGLSFHTDPGILIKIRHAPDLRLSTVRWDFDKAEFDVSASANWFDVFGVIGKVGAWKIRKVLDARLKPLLPDAMRTAGYSPARDPDLAGTTQQLSRVFAFAQGPAAGGPGQAQGGTAGLAKQLRDPSAGLGVSMPEDLVVPLGTEGLELVIAKGTHLDVRASATGQVVRPAIESLRLGAGSPGIQIKPKEGLFKEVKELDLHAVTIGRGGTFNFDYDLSAETMIEGLAALAMLVGLAAGQRVSGNVPDVRLEAIRKEIDARLQAEVPPRFKTFLKRYDGLVPGFSLTSVFGV